MFSLIIASLAAVQSYNFSGFPAADVPPPINPAWVKHYGLDSTDPSLPPVKNPQNSLEYPTCPGPDVGRNGGDWSCYNVTR